MKAEEKKFFTMSVDETLKSLNSSKKGLSDDEAKKRIGEYGYNKLAEKQKQSLLSKFIDQFKDLMIIVLLVAISIVVYDNVPKKMQIYFIDVDQGDSTLIISPKGTSILIDTGEDETRVYKYLLNRRINKLD